MTTILSPFGDRVGETASPVAVDPKWQIGSTSPPEVTILTQIPGGDPVAGVPFAWEGRAMREAWLTLPAFTVLYVAAGLLGRATSLDNQSLSLVWPATGIAVLWFLNLVGKWAVALSAALLVVATVLISFATRSTFDLGAVFAVAHLAQVAVVVLLVRRWCPELGVRGGQPPLETPAALLRFMGATAVGCGFGAAVGIVGLLVVGESFAPISAVAWWGRNVCGVLALGTTGLLLLHRFGPGRSTHGPISRARALETTALVAATVGLVALDYSSGLSFSFLLPATTVWAGLRFTPLVVSSQAVLGGVAVVWLTLSGDGPFGGSGAQGTQVVLAELFVGMTIMIGLFLAAGRQESARLHAELNQRQEDLATFARRVAHELQSPLMLIDGWAELLAVQLKGPATEEGRHPQRDLDMVRRMQAATRQMGDLVRDLLSDATTRREELARNYVDLSRVALDIVESREVRDLVRVGAIPPVAGDASMLHRLLDNLIGNSLKYVAPGEVASVELSAEIAQDDMVAVRVVDRGIGIPSGHHDTVFDEFSRAHGEAYPGTGLGLSICRRIVERHGGDIKAYEGQPGPGTVVEFRLPRWGSDHTTHRDEVRTTALVSSERASN